jgi:hypothetical protein
MISRDATIAATASSKTPQRLPAAATAAEIDQLIDNSQTRRNNEAATNMTQAQTTAANFMSKFRDKDTRVLKNLNSQQFIEVWNNYDKDGKSKRVLCVCCEIGRGLDTFSSAASL